MKLVNDWKKAWRWYSVQANVIAVAFISTWAVLPEEFKQSLPQEWALGITIVLVLAGTVGRVVDQEKKDASPD